MQNNEMKNNTTHTGSRLTAAANKRVNDAWINPVRPNTALVGIMRAHIVQERPVLTHDVGDSFAWNKLHHSLLRPSGEYGIRRQLDIEILLPKQPIHKSKKLDDKLILTQVVSVLENDRIL
jgi:hypothetical protein